MDLSDGDDTVLLFGTDAAPSDLSQNDDNGAWQKTEALQVRLFQVLKNPTVNTSLNHSHKMI
jgi:hypothetical protein